MAQRARAVSADVSLGDQVVTPVDIELSSSARARGSAWSPEDIVDEWGAQSFPASDPPSNW